MFMEKIVNKENIPAVIQLSGIWDDFLGLWNMFCAVECVKLMQELWCSWMTCLSCVSQKERF